MDKQIILVHGRNFKPPKEHLLENWREALLAGVKRDYPGRLDKVEAVDMKMAYYGTASNKFLRERGKKYDESQDIANRAQVLRQLKKYDKEAFNKETYNKLRGKTSRKELLADLFHGPLDFFNVADNIIGRVAPDVKHYWNDDSEFGSKSRWPLTKLLSDALTENKQVLLLSHSLGTMIAYDVLWKFSHYSEYRQLARKKVDLWRTLGSPLGNPTVMDNLKGSGAKRRRRYPTNITRWVNVAAEDDYISHDETVTDDFKKMISGGLVDSIVDHRIYNLAVRLDDNGKPCSNPHHGAGYLIHPNVAKLVAGWAASK